MSVLPDVRIDLKDTFPHLARAPIVEAVIEIRARAEVAWEASSIRSKVEARVPDYPNIQSQQEFEGQFRIVGLEQQPEQTLRDLGWKGLRCQCADKPQIAQFNRDSFVFSRLQPYQSWEEFQSEALRLWEIHCELAKPGEVQRLGLRFIDRIEIPSSPIKLEDYLQRSPELPRDLDLPFAGFFYLDVLAVPGYPYAINLARTIQPLTGSPGEGAALIIDIDVFTTQPLQPERAMLERRLAEMRWLKNRAFFGSIKQEVLEKLK